jgi:succinate-semialdehyde dehydrogenase/glutarate-semialdehyde dehydrogenase
VLVATHHAGHAERLLAPRRHPGALPRLTRVELRRPKGIVTMIALWNSPLALAVADAVPALLAGNAVVHKPDTQTTLSALLCRLAVEAGLMPRANALAMGSLSMNLSMNSRPTVHLVDSKHEAEPA